MSTIKVNSIKNTSTDDGGIAIDNSGHVQVDGVQLPTAGALSSRRININGAMQVAQRGTSTTGVSSSGFYSVDRMKIGLSSLGTYTVTQESDGPAGFSKSYKIDCTTADSSPAVSDFFKIDYNIEGQDLQNLDYGASTAKALTLTFYVKSNKTGDASLEIQQKDNSDRQVSPQYTINAANTWEKKTINIPADASGLINDDTGTGLRISWWLNSGSTYQGGSHQTTWVTEANSDRNVSNLGIGGSTNDYWQITGVQLEVGEKATPFEHRSFGDELARCQRYCHVKKANGAVQAYEPVGIGRWCDANRAQIMVNHPVPLRAIPSATFSAAGTFLINTVGSLSGASPTSMSLNEPGIECSTIFAHYSSGGRTVGQATTLYSDGTEVAEVTFSSEL